MTTKTVFQTDRLGIYIGTTSADESPLEEGVYLLPRGCVETPPPAIPEGKAAHWDGTRWQLIDAKQGLTAYNTNTGEPLQIQRLGELPAGYTLEVPKPGQVWRDGDWVDDVPAVVAALHQSQTAAINRGCETAITAGFTSAALGAPHTYSSQLDDQLNLTGAILRGLDMPYACRDEQGQKEFRLHTIEQLRHVGDDFSQAKLQLLQRANQLKQLLDAARAAADVDAMAAITWEADLP